MFTKIICEKGRIFLCTDINQKIETVNSLNVIDMAEYENKIELLEQEKESLTIKNNTIEENITNMSIDVIVATFVYILLLIIPAYRVLFDMINSVIPIFSIVEILFYIGMPIGLLNKFFRVIPKEKKKLYANTKTIEFIDKKTNSIQKEKEKLLDKPKLSLIREGQEFTIKNGEELYKTLNTVHSYYYDKDDIDDYIISLKQEEKTDDEIINLFYDFAKNNDVPLNRQEVAELLDIVYSCMEEDTDINIKKKTK